MMFGLQRKSSKEKPPRQTVSQFPFKYSLNNFDEFVSVQEKPNRRCKEQNKTTRDVADPKRRLFQFDVLEFGDNFEKGMMKTLKDISKKQKKSTSTRTPVAEPSLFISKKFKGKSETNVEELKYFSDSLPIYDEYDEEPVESLMIYITVLQPEHPSSLVLSQQVFEEEPLDYPHQGPCLDTRNPLDEDLGHIFDEEDEPGPVFDQEATSITSIIMESHLCFDPGITPVSLTPDLQEHLFVLSIQERQKVFCHQYNFPGKTTKQGFTEAWNHFNIFTEEGVMNFQNRRFSSLSIREYQTSKGDSSPRKKRPEPKPILNEPNVFPQSTSFPNQKHCKDHGLIVSTHHENVLNPRISKFDVVSLVVLNEQDKHDQFPRRASTDLTRIMPNLTWIRDATCPIRTPATLADHPAALADRPAYVTVLTALDLAGQDAS
uniref:Uncharacterized protein n=1 Tax=Brassica campestris TaxID=3711 RepID=M4FHK5_BRACM